MRARGATRRRSTRSRRGGRRMRRSRCGSCAATTIVAPAIRRARSESRVWTDRCSRGRSPWRIIRESWRSGTCSRGHVHPCAVLVGAARQRERLACFHFGREVGVLPSFGDFTGCAVIEPVEGDQRLGGSGGQGPSDELSRDGRARRSSLPESTIKHDRMPRMPTQEDQRRIPDGTVVLVGIIITLGIFAYVRTSEREQHAAEREQPAAASGGVGQAPVTSRPQSVKIEESPRDNERTRERWPYVYRVIDSAAFIRRGGMYRESRHYS